MPRIILTDIEGTTSSISFVKEVLFPYARGELPAFVREHADTPQVRRWLDLVAQETGQRSVETLVATLQQWIDEDRKHPALKGLQGLIWAAGYEQDDYRAHVYADAAQALPAWHRQGYTLAVYSSGSVPAQKLFFGYSEAGDLAPLFSAWFDTEVGGKREVDSYRRISEALQADPADILFLSDVVEELDAARTAGLQTVLLDRRDDYPEPRTGDAANGHARVERFSDIEPEQISC